LGVQWQKTHSSPREKAAMKSLNDLIRRIIDLRAAGRAQLCLFAACPNSSAVLEAAVQVAAANNAPMLFAATLNQVDRDGGYTGWTAPQFVQEMNRFAAKYNWQGPLYPCLDHGGPWLKDKHTKDQLSLVESMAEVKASLTDCLIAGYQLLHIDPTVDRTLPGDAPVPIELVVARTVDLIAHAEQERLRMGLPPVAYEVGTEEVHGGLVDMDNFRNFIYGLRAQLEAQNLLEAWPCFIVGKVGTDLHTSFFDPESAAQLFEIVAPLGSLIKGHYTDWVENPEAYPANGMGGANVGPEFTAEEYLALADLEAKEAALVKSRPGVKRAGFLAALEQAVYESNRWQKWLQPDEQGLAFSSLATDRRDWLVQTGARYVWTDASVQAARARLYATLAPVLPDANQYVVDRIARSMDRYINAFHLFDANTIFA
jgi:D-tagatose-1,6-bisphosphate aldolase subunit GatZ/KbaZ